MKFKVELGRQANLILALLLIHFVFFGYVCYRYGEDIGLQLIYLYRVFFNRRSYLSLFILILIIFIMVARERFFEYGIRNSIWLTLGIVIESWIWYWVANGYEFEFNYLKEYFTKAPGYVTIISILCINFLTAILAGYIRQLYEERIKIIEKQ